MNKKVFLLITKAEVGGAQVSVLNLARGLRSRGVEVKVGFGLGDFLPKELDKLDLPYTRFKYLQRTHNPLANLLFSLEIRRFFNNNHFEVVHINSSNALMAGLGVKLSRSQAKTVFTFRGMSMLDSNYSKASFLSYFYKLYFKFFLRFIDEPVFVSKQNLEHGEKTGLVKKGSLVYNGLEKSVLNFYTRDQARKILSDKIGFNLDISFCLGSIGRLAYQKNYEFLIKVFPKILDLKPGAKLLVIGSGSEKGKYEKLIKENKLEKNVFLLGSLDNASRYLKAFDLFVLPSRYEGLSITLIEALWAGAPILASRVGGNQETLPTEEELYELDNEQDFLDKFKVLIQEGKSREVGDKNLEYSDKFLLEKTIQGYLEVYNK